MEKPRPKEEKRHYFDEYLSAAVSMRGKASFFYVNEYMNFAKDIRRSIIGIEESQLPALFAI
jgi:hypothetical protein